MEIILGKTAGFCYGVKRAVEGCGELASSNEQIYCLGELIHNKHVISELENAGVNFINDLNEVKNKQAKIVIRAHGVSKKIYENAKSMNLKLVDYTCPMVLKIHDIVKEYNDKNYYIILTGKSTHPEVIGISSFADNISIIEKADEVNSAINSFLASGLKKMLLISQTTFNTLIFSEIEKKIREIFPFEDGLITNNTICNATEARQNETIELSKQVDFMIIIGGKNSSNTRKLYDISKQNCANSIMVESKEDLQSIDFSKFNKIGIMAGASTPKNIINEIIEVINWDGSN